ncbi:AraC family transcriptional regulator [Advenella kashmirensis W13003]|uniref:AraC family transcriptional regulator n=1 Tax=Advenella kashmirensis W13003 TaxID=1424334 RepID=V8QSM1_9BURK|nr:AraC family transcriptional regulator [Advenella kashmirensis]ETF02325.1 AraC family transcriptional regulator [Advenella kashmirensis W13003]
MQVVNSTEFFDNHKAAASGTAVKTLDLQPGLAVSLVRFETGQNMDAVTEDDADARVHFNCLLRGTTSIRCDGRSFELDSDDVLATFTPGKRYQIDCSAGWCNIELRITPQLLCELAGEESEALYQGCSNDFCLMRNASNLRIRDATDRLGRLLAEDNSSPLLVHAAALEFLAWQLKSLQPEAISTGLAPRERRQLLAARERLLADLSNPPTIEQLARETGLNQLKLKRGFKSLFGVSVYALFQRERMEHARRLLLQHSVTETAIQLGYSNFSHFSTAFRKQFGVLPSEARRFALT